MKLAERVLKVPPSGIRRLFDLATGAPGIISLGVGEPDFDTPEHIKEAGIRAIKEGKTHYTSNYGIKELREEIVRKLERENKIDVGIENVLITSGTSEAFAFSLMATVDPGDEVLYSDPAYVAYKPTILFSGGTPVPVPSPEERGFKIDPEELERRISKKSKVLVIITPSNPTGAVLDKKTLEEIADISVEHDLLVISDEIYEKLIYRGKHVSMASLNGMEERTITINGFSKAYAMTGWRVGYVVAPEEIIDGILKIHQYDMICAPTPSQYAALEAIRGPQDCVDEMRREYDKRRNFMVKTAYEIEGMSCVEPEGAFYAFPNVEEILKRMTDRGGKDPEFKRKYLSGKKQDEGLMDYLFEEAKVVVVAGSYLGEFGEGYLRLSYATSRDKIKEAMERIDEAISRI